MKHRWLLLLAVLLALLPCLARRWQWEAEHSTVTLLFDSRALEQLAEQSDATAARWLRELKEAGLTGLALWPENLETLKQRGALTWLTRTQALQSPYWKTAYPEGVQGWLSREGDGILIALWDQETAEWLTQALEQRDIPVETVTGQGITYLLTEEEGELTQLPLGFWPETVETAEDLGLRCCAVLSLPEEENDLALADALYQMWEEAGVHTLLAMGGGLPGWSQWEEGAQQRFQAFAAQGGALALVESSQQQGSVDFPGKEAALQETGSLLRCFYQWDYVSDRYGALGYEDSREVSMALARAAAERNCRILWLTAMTDSETGKTVEDLAEYTCLLGQLEQDLTRFGLETGPAQAGDADPGLPVLLAQVLSWGTAAGTGCLCGWLLLRLRRGWGQLIFCQSTALIGGLAASAWLSGTLFFLGEESFRGVKLAQLVPLAWFVLLWGRDQWRRRKGEICRWCATPVTGGVLLLSAGACLGLLLLAGLGVYYLARTGNSGLATDWELRVRNTLEEWCTVRPRFKEFALGLPCLALWCFGRLPRWTEPVVGLGAMVGLVSVTNTFLHLFTPVRISLIRTGAGWLLGGLLSLLLLGLLRLGRRFRWPAS